MSDEQRYTLDEAAAELRRQECARRGHSWDVHSTCSNCGKSGTVTMDPEDTPNS